MTGYDVIVVGAGVVGAATAAALAAEGVTVAVADAHPRQPSATSVSGGLVRAYEPDARLRSLAMRSYDLLWRGPAPLRDGAAFRPVGSLVVLGPDELAHAGAAMAELADHAIDAELLTPRQVASRWPGLGVAGMAAALWEPDGGYADPSATAKAYLGSAIARGAAVVAPGQVRTIRWDGNRVRGVCTDEGELVARAVVLAAGCGVAGLLPAQARARLGLHTRRIRYALLSWPTRPLPALVDGTNGMWGRPVDADRLLVGRPVDEWDVPPGSGSSISAAQLAYIRGGGADRWPGLSSAPLVGARWGTDLYRAEGPLLGPLPRELSPGLVLAGAWSGGGFKVAPAAGEAAARAALAIVAGS